MYDPAAEHPTGFGDEPSDESYGGDTGTIPAGPYRTNPNSGGNYDIEKSKKFSGGSRGGGSPSSPGSSKGKADGGTDIGIPTVSGNGGGLGSGAGSGPGRDGWLPEVAEYVLMAVFIAVAAISAIAVISAFAMSFSFSMAGLTVATQAAAAEATPFLAGIIGITVTPESEVETSVGRSGALNQIKRDLGIPRSQQPEAINRVPMTDRMGKLILDEDGLPIITREYLYERPDGRSVVVQDHSAGHEFGEGGVGDQGPHFNVRPPENTRTGSVPGAQSHYPFNK